MWTLLRLQRGRHPSIDYVSQKIVFVKQFDRNGSGPVFESSIAAFE
jgi:hypothetical protein